MIYFHILDQHATPNKMMKYILLSSLLALQQEAAALSASQTSRHEFMKQLSTGIVAFGSSMAIPAMPQVAHGAAIDKTAVSVLRSDKCAYGEGAGCESLAGDNEFIKELQRKSSEKKEASKQVSPFNVV